jgi:predicted DCC family thiol-disulfide oxidoreductase YuxK
MSSPLLLAYDPACLHCCRLAIALARQDRRGLLLIASQRDPDLMALAPELAGRPLEKEVHGLDLATRRISAGADLLRPIARRLPAWWWLFLLLGIPGLPNLTNRIFLYWSAWRFRRTGHHPFA